MRVYRRSMPRPPRVTDADTLYHVWVRATGGGALFVDSDDRQRHGSGTGDGRQSDDGHADPASPKNLKVVVQIHGDDTSS